MGTYHVAQICVNGHVINTSVDWHPESSQTFCATCGAATTERCEGCQAPIRGYYEGPGIGFAQHYERPSFCYRCGLPYPWTLSSVTAAKMLAASLDTISENERAELEKSLEELIRDTPGTKVAELSFKRIMRKVGTEGYEAMKSILVDIVSEAVRKSLFGP